MNFLDTPQGLFGPVVLASLPEFGRRDEGISRGHVLSFTHYELLDVGRIGAAGRSRTFDARVFNAALYRLSYDGMERAARIELA